MGQTEAPLLIKPYLPGMTRSELHCMMVGGFATIAGSVMGVYSGLLKVPAGHLLTASVMSAPAALLISKIIIPETQVSETAAGSTAKIERETVNGIDAACSGASDGMKLAINVIAMLLAFTSLVAAVNWFLGQGFSQLGWQTQQPLQTLLGYANAPFAWLMGIPSKDCLAVGQILGERIVLTEFVGYLSCLSNKRHWTPAVTSLPPTRSADSPTSAAWPFKLEASVLWCPADAKTWPKWASRPWWEVSSPAT